MKRSALPVEFCVFDGCTNFRCKVESLTIETVQDAKLGLADTSRISSIAWKTGSNSPGEELMTCSTSEVAVCCSNNFAQFVEQPGILNGDYGLVGECCYQVDFFVGEGSYERTSEKVIIVMPFLVSGTPRVVRKSPRD